MPSKFRTALLASLVTLLVAVPAGVWAGHTFTDVPSSNVFHDDIEWLAEVGVTKGCNPPDNTEFCPDENVTREQMAAFLRRLTENQIGLFGEDFHGFNETTSTTYSPIEGLSTQVTIPDGHRGVISVDLNTQNRCRTVEGRDQCFIRLLVDGEEIQAAGDVFDDTADGGDGIETQSIMRITDELGPGTYTITAEAKVSSENATFRTYQHWMLAEAHLTS